MANINNNLEYINEQARLNPKEFVVNCEQRYNNIIEDITSLNIAIPFFCRIIRLIDKMIWITPTMVVIISSVIFTSYIIMCGYS